MPDAKITDLPEVLAPAPSDLVVVETDPAGTPATKKATVANLLGVAHQHTIAHVTNLQTALDGKAAAAHVHAIADTTGLQTALDGKSAVGHLHDDRYYTEIEADTLLAGKAAASHAHAIADTTGLQTALDGKAAAQHSHAIADVTNLQTTLDAKQATSAKGQADGYAALDAATKVPTAQLGGAGADATKFLRGDQAWAVPPGGGGGLTFQEADRATDLALSTSFQAAASLSLGAGTWLVLGQSSIESTSTTQGNVNIRIRDQTNAVTYSIAEGEVDSALPDRCSLAVHAVIVLAAPATIALEGRQSAGTSHMIGPGNLGDTVSKVTRLTAVKIA